jgi:HTH-type transcriptional regulator, competence development regulator
MDSLGAYLRRLRKSCGLTLKQVEERGVASNAYLSQLERGLRKSPRPDILKRMAEVYGEPLKNLMIEAGYLPAETERERTREETEIAFEKVQKDSGFPHGARRRGLQLSLEAKRYFVELYEKTTGRRIN